MPTVFCLAGTQGAQTTQLLHGLAAELARRGFKVGLITREADSPTPPPRGALLEMRVGPGGVYLSHAQWRPPSLDQVLARHAQGLDVVLSQLHQDQKVYKIEFCPAGSSPALLGDSNLKALVSQEPLPGVVPCFSPQDLAGLTQLLIGLLPPPGRPLLRMLVDGRKLPAKDFVQEIIASTIRALIGSLKGGQGAKGIEIHLALAPVLHERANRPPGGPAITS
ncbi:DUF4388 domain-containing protein [Desulfarculales bacterium]